MQKACDDFFCFSLSSRLHQNAFCAENSFHLPSYFSVYANLNPMSARGLWSSPLPTGCSGTIPRTKQRFCTRRKLQIYNGNAPAPLPIAHCPALCRSWPILDCVHNFYTRFPSHSRPGESVHTLPTAPRPLPTVCYVQLPNYNEEKLQCIGGGGRGRGWGRTTGLTANPSRQAKSERAFFAYYRPRNGLPPHSAKCSSNQRCSRCAASLTPLPLGRLLPRFVATFYAFFQRLRRRLLFQLQDKCDSIKPCHAPKTQQNMPQCRAAPPTRCPAPSLHRRAAKNCQA